MRFIRQPNLPRGRVTRVLISSQTDRNILSLLNRMGIETVLLPPCDNMPPPVASHADLLVQHLGGRELVVNPELSSQIQQTLRGYGYSLIPAGRPEKAEYPYDISLDAARVGDRLICRTRNTDRTILEYCKAQGIQMISVQQGYAKCSICVVDENSLITADTGIAKSALAYGMNVLEIHSGYIKLPGYGYGFIGGSSLKLSADLIGFFGDLTGHPDYIRIKNFLRARGIGIIMLGQNSLTDYGGAVAIAEK